MKKRWIIPVLAAAAATFLGACGSAPVKGEINQKGASVFPVSTHDESLAVTMGDVMPFYDNGVMNIYHLQNTSGETSLYYHPISRLTTTDFVHYTDEGVALNFEQDIDSVDAALGTGSFIKDSAGNYHCFYTGHNDNGQSVGMPFNEVIRHAVSYDNQESWQKDEDFKIYGYENDFRDPYVYYDNYDECYYMLVTTRDYGVGVIKQYSATTLDASADEWHDCGIFFKNDEGDYNMECPSYIEYNGYFYLAYSEQGNNRVTHYRYKSSREEEWQKFERDSIDSSGFYAGRLEKTENKLYAFAWCARLAGGSSGGFDWGGNLVTHELYQNPDTGELSAVMVSNVKQAFSTEIAYTTVDGKGFSEFNFDGEKFRAYGIEKLSSNITRMHFTIELGDKGGDFGLTFGLNGAYDNRLGSALIAFDAKNSRLICYNEVSSILRYGTALAHVPFVFDTDREYGVDVIIEGEILTVYLDDTVALTARLSNIESANFAFYSNGVEAQIKGIKFYE